MPLGLAASASCWPAGALPSSPAIFTCPARGPPLTSSTAWLDASCMAMPPGLSCTTCQASAALPREGEVRQHMYCSGHVLRACMAGMLCQQKSPSRRVWKFGQVCTHATLSTQMVLSSFPPSSPPPPRLSFLCTLPRWRCSQRRGHLPRGRAGGACRERGGGG